MTGAEAFVRGQGSPVSITEGDSRPVKPGQYYLRVKAADGLTGVCRHLRREVGVVAFLALSVVWSTSALLAQDQYALVVTGASGESSFGERYDRWRSSLVTALRVQPMFEETHLVVLAERPGPDVGRASRAGVRQAVEQLAARMGRDSVLYIVLIGHGSFDGVDAKFNLVGPDLEAREWATLLSLLPGHLVFVNTTGASYPFLARLSGPSHTIVTATGSSVQRFETIFPEFFISALAELSADLDKSGRVSVLEAFEFASSGVRQWYRQRGQLATERALIDDNGDGRGRESGEPGPDGVVAGRLYPGAGPVESLVDTDPFIAPLVARLRELQRAVDELKAVKDKMDAAAYRRELELLLLELARVSRQIRLGAAG